MIDVKSTAFEPGGKIPKRHAGEGENVSPPLSWRNIPEGTREIALICEDPDAPQPEPWVHWVVHSIPPDTGSLPEGAANGGVEGTNSLGNKGYSGPMPPLGHGTHHYHYRVYALDKETGLGVDATKQDLLKTIDGHIIDLGEVVGTYERSL